MEKHYNQLTILAVSCVIAPISSFMGMLFIPFCILICLNIADYFTGISASKYRGKEVNSKIGLRGIIKKICLWILVAIGGVLDYLLMFAKNFIYENVKLKFFIATVICIWLICNEIISILENIKDIGVKFPPFMEKITKNIRSQVEDKAEKLIKGDNQNEK